MATANVRQLPPPRKGRIRNSRGMMSMGKCSILLLDREGEDIPDNIVRLDCPKPPAPLVRSPTLMLALCLYFEASAKTREGIKQTLRGMAYSGCEDSIRLLAFLKREA